MTGEIKIKILGTKEQLAELHDEMLTEPGEFRIERHGIEKDKTNLRFGLAEIGAIVAILKGAEALIKLGDAIYKLLSRPPGNRIVVQTPRGRVEFVSHEELSREKIARALNSLVSAVQ